MNIYLIVEGLSEKKVYPRWVKYLNPQLNFVEQIDQVDSNKVFLVSGMGYPYYYEIIESAIEDIESTQSFDRLVVSVDSEEMTHQEKFEELNEFILSKKVKFDYKIVIQHFCLETWALGNKFIISRNPTSQNVRDYRRFFDVLNLDPELLPAYNVEDLNRSQFADKYLRSLLNEKFRNLTYTKQNPSALLHRNYFDRIRRRLNETHHIKSFNDFLLAFN